MENAAVIPLEFPSASTSETVRGGLLMSQGFFKVPKLRIPQVKPTLFWRHGWKPRESKDLIFRGPHSPCSVRHKGTKTSTIPHWVRRPVIGRPDCIDPQNYVAKNCINTIRP